MRAMFGFTMTIVAAWLAVVGCSYNPEFKDGELKCSLAGECPDGYSCRANACFSNSVDGGGAGGAGGPSQGLVNRYVGDWTLDPTAMVVTRCDDGTSGTTLLSPATDPSMMNIVAGTAGQPDLICQWLCVLGLKLDTSGAHLSDASRACAGTSTEPVQSWTTSQFDIVATTTKLATHTATYSRSDKYASGKVVTCSQKVTATLTK